MPPPLPDRIGRYKVIELLAASMDAPVYRVRDERLEIDRALKLFDRPLPVQWRTGFREAQSVSRLLHHNIAVVCEVDEHEGHAYIVMEYLVGQSLKVLMEDERVVPLSTSLFILEQICAGLSYAHRCGIVHGGLSPTKVFVVDAWSVKLLGFGVDQFFKLTGMMRLQCGRRDYVAPEQLLGDVATAQADIFVVGMLAHELLRHRPAFNYMAAAGGADALLSETREPIDRVAGHLKRSLVSLINRCLEKRPEDRYQDMHEVEQQLAVIRRAVLKHEESATGATGWSRLLKAIVKATGITD